MTEIGKKIEEDKLRFKSAFTGNWQHGIQSHGIVNKIFMSNCGMAEIKVVMYPVERELETSRRLVLCSFSHHQSFFLGTQTGI